MSHFNCSRLPIRTKMSPLTEKCPRGMSKDEEGNVQGEMSKNAPELTDDELALSLEPFERQSARDKKNRRRQAIRRVWRQVSDTDV